MFRFSSWAVGLVAFSMAGGAFAQDPEPMEDTEPEAAPAPVADASAGVSTDGNGENERKIRLGLRLGYALPMGSAVEGGKMSEEVSGQIPIWLDAGYMVTPNVLIGLYGQYGFVSLKQSCDGCSAHDIRFGVQGQYHFSPAESVDPWLGLGVGYEILGFSQSAQGQTVDISFKGFEFLNLQGGADFKVGNAFSVGPFLSFSLGQYSKASANDQSADIDKTALHQWLTFGAKGTFGL